MASNLSDLAIEGNISGLSDELILYFQNKFFSNKTNKSLSFADEASIHIWVDHNANSVGNETFQQLKRCYPQLNFPIEKEIDKKQDYIDTVLKGKRNDINLKNELNLYSSESIKIIIYKSIAGKVPVLIIPDGQDFVKIIQCILYKNNPISIPSSMGALLVNGINNWTRIHALKEEWLEINPLGNWSQEFSKNVLPDSSLYKDRLIVLSEKPYSNITASSLGLTEDVWKAYSYLIRLAHECTHLYTLKRYGSASNNLHDELVADYIGISSALGRYNREWMLAFMGLEEYPNYKKGARLENYLGNADISSEYFNQLITIIKNAIDTIFSFDTELGEMNSDDDCLHRIDALCETDLLDIASTDGLNLLIQKFKEVTRRY